MNDTPNDRIDDGLEDRLSAHYKQAAIITPTAKTTVSPRLVFAGVSFALLIIGLVGFRALRSEPTPEVAALGTETTTTIGSATATSVSSTLSSDTTTSAVTEASHATLTNSSTTTPITREAVQGTAKVMPSSTDSEPEPEPPFDDGSASDEFRESLLGLTKDEAVAKIEANGYWADIVSEGLDWTDQGDPTRVIIVVNSDGIVVMAP